MGIATCRQVGPLHRLPGIARKSQTQRAPGSLTTQNDRAALGTDSLPMTSRSHDLLHLVIIVALGLGTMIYAGPGAGLVRHQLGGTFYVLAWFYLALWMRPGWRPLPVGLTVFALTCLVELSQLWHPHWLELLRDHRIGQLLLGSSFDWLDFPGYGLGLLIGLGLERGRLGEDG